MDLNQHRDTMLHLGAAKGLETDDTALSDEVLDWPMDRAELCVTCQSCGRRRPRVP
jgi:hypothetical protein